MKIEIKNRISGEVIYSHECENNTIKKTVVNAIKENTDLWNADLSDADLWNANLRNANGNGREINSVQTNVWQVTMTKKVMQIGCKQFSLKKWRKFTDEQISEMDEQALDFWNDWKKILFKIHKLSFINK